MLLFAAHVVFQLRCAVEHATLSEDFLRLDLRQTASIERTLASPERRSPFGLRHAGHHVLGSLVAVVRGKIVPGRPDFFLPRLSLRMVGVFASFLVHERIQ